MARVESTTVLVLTQVVEPPALVAQVPTAVQNSLALIWGVVRDRMQDANGTAVRSAADGLLAVFDDIESAVTFTAAVQQEVLDLTWPPTLTVHDEAKEVLSATGDRIFMGLRVRQAIHVGQSDVRGEGEDTVHYGPAVHQLARVANVGFGGQVLLSESAIAAMRTVPDGVTLRDLGRHRLQGVHGVYGISLVLPEALDARTFPELRTPDRRKTNLVPMPSLLLGRDGDIAALKELLDFGVRLLTVTGVEGVGKSRMVRRFAERNIDSLAGDDTGGVWYCNLAGARDVDGLVWALASALNVPLTMHQAIEPTLQQLGDALAARGETLLVLDGIDGLRTVLTQVLPSWMADAGQCRFLLTGRKRLGLPGEIAFELGPLEVGAKPTRNADAVRLFETRTKRVDPNLQLDVNVAHRIVDRLHGNPMLIELAATTMGTRSAQELLDALPENGVRKLVRALGQVCWATLDDDERTVLNRCSVIAGWFGVHRAEQVVSNATSRSVRDLLESLVARGLVRVDEFGDAPGIRRYSLHPRIREFAWSRLDKPARQTLGRRYADNLIEVTESWVSRAWRPDGPAVVARLALEWRNLMGIYTRMRESDHASDMARATRAVLVLDPLLESRGPLATRHRVLDEAIRLSDGLGADPIIQVRSLMARARSRPPAEAAVAVTELERALAVAERWNDPVQATRVRYGLANALWNTGQTDRARALFETCVQAFRNMDDGRREGLVMGTLGVMHMEGGRLQEGIDHLTAAVLRLEEVGARHAQAVVLTNLAVANRRMDRPDEARVHYRKALRIHQANGSRRHEADVTSNMGVLDYHLNRLDAARESYEQALAVCRQLGHKAGEAVCLANLGLIELEHDEVNNARTLMLQAMALHRSLSVLSGEGTVAGYLGLLYHRTGQSAQAKDWYGRATRMLKKAENHRFKALFQGWRAVLHAEDLEIDRAETLFNLAHIDLANAGDPPMQRALAAMRLSLDLARADAAHRDGDTRAAQALRAEVREKVDAYEAAQVQSGDLRLAIQRIETLLVT